MIKRLRDRKNWSQEQLAVMSGLSVRTIQRIEGGNKASLESLKALASVFEVEISTLTEEIIMIDKESATWVKQPRWFKLLMLGITKRRSLILSEYMAAVLGCVFWLGKLDSAAAAAFLLCAYITSKLVAKADKEKLW